MNYIREYESFDFIKGKVKKYINIYKKKKYIEDASKSHRLENGKFWSRNRQSLEMAVDYPSTNDVGKKESKEKYNIFEFFIDLFDRLETGTNINRFKVYEYPKKEILVEFEISNDPFYLIRQYYGENYKIINGGENEIEEIIKNSEELEEIDDRMEDIGFNRKGLFCHGPGLYAMSTNLGRKYFIRIVYEKKNK